MHALLLLVIASFPLTVAAQSYRFDGHLADARQLTVTPVAEGVRGYLLPPPVTWRVSASVPSSKAQIEGDHVVLEAKEPDWLYSPKGLDIEPSEVGYLELELRVTGQDTVQVLPGFSWDRQPCEIAVPQQGEYFTARIDPREQNGWMFPRIDQIMIGVKGEARLEVRSVRVVPSLVVAALGTRLQWFGNSVRQTLFAQCPMALEYTLRVPRQGFIAAGLGVVKEAQPVEFSVDVSSGGVASRVLARRVETVNEWVDVEADLASFAGQEVTITLNAACDAPGQVALWGNPAVLERRVPGAHTPPNIVYYVVDALRADHLDAYGYLRKTAPAVAAWAQGGVRFDWCLSQSTWTPTSVPSFHTSVGPLAHKINLLFGESVPSSLVTFPELLREAGYTTGAVSDNGCVPPETMPRSSYGTVMGKRAFPNGPTATENVNRFLDANRDRPFLLYVHTMEAHIIVNSDLDCYVAPPPFRGSFSSGSAPPELDNYDDGIAYASKNFDDVLKKLATLGLTDNTLVIFSADHGEAFLEHDSEDRHGNSPYMEEIHVPLVISWPGMLPAGMSFGQTVSLLDVAPTILDYAGIPIPPQFQGMSLRGLVEGTGVRPFQERTVFSCGLNSPWPLAINQLAQFAFFSLVDVSPRLARFMYDVNFEYVYSAVKSPWALWRNCTSGPTHLYNLALDPKESTDVAEQNPEVVQTMSGEIDEYLRQQAELSMQLGTTDADKRNTFGAAQKETIKALGYLGAK